MGPEADLIVQVKKALHQVRAPVYYDGQKHDAEYPQVIIAIFKMSLVLIRGSRKLNLPFLWMFTAK